MQTRRLLGSFQNRLALLFGGIALLVGLPTALVINHIYTTQLIADRGLALQGLANAISGVLSDNLQKRLREAEYLAELPLYRNGKLDSDNFMQHAVGLQKSHPYFTWIGLADPDGAVTAASGNTLVGQNVAQRPWFIEASKHPYIGDLHEALLLSKHLPAKAGDGPVRFIDFAAPVKDADGNLRGVVGIHAHWQWAAQLIASLADQSARQAQQEVLILSAQGQVIFPEQFDAEPPTQTPNAPRFQIERWPSGTEYLTAYAPVKEANAAAPLGWKVVLRQPKADALREVQALQHLLVACAILSAIVFMLLAWWSARRVGLPLRQLAQSAERIERGEEALRFEIRTSTDELTQLVNALRGMASKLILRKAELEASNLRLEQRVQERTAELERLNLELKHLARSDSLTGLPNRLAANERLREEFLRMKRTRTPYAVLLLDIDHFKQINDTFGHAVGDRVLAQVGGILKAAVRETDFVGRFGGEEFLAVLPDTDLSAALQVAEKIRRSIETTPPPDDVRRVTLSIGVAEGQAEHNSEDDAVRIADDWLYDAKRNGRNRVAPHA